MVIIGLLLIIALIVLIKFSVEIFVRKLGDIGKFFVRIAENTALSIMFDRRLDIMLIAVPGEEMERWKEFCAKKNKAAGYEKFILLKKSGGLYYIGVPWKHKVYEWWETEKDKEQGIKVLHSVDLAETIISYPSADPGVKINDPDGVPNYESADPVEVTSSLVVYFVIRDPEKALFSVRYRKEAMKKQIFPVWRATLSMMSFYEYTSSNSKETTGEKEVARAKGEILQLANQKLRASLGLLVEKEGVLVKPEKYDSSIVAMFENDWGMWIRDVVVTDLEEKGTTIRDALAKRLEAKATALALVEKTAGEVKKTIMDAEANKQANILLGEGEKALSELRGKGEASYIASVIDSFTVGSTTNEAKAKAAEHALAARYYDTMKNLPADGRQLIYQWPNLPSEKKNSIIQVMESVSKNPELIQKLPEILAKIIEKGG